MNSFHIFLIISVPIQDILTYNEVHIHITWTKTFTFSKIQNVSLTLVEVYAVLPIYAKEFQLYERYKKGKYISNIKTKGQDVNNKT